MTDSKNNIHGGDPMAALAERYVKMFDDLLEVFCRSDHPDVPPRLMDAMTYSLSAGGKRLRPALCLAAAEMCGSRPEVALPMALAIEFMHTASLIHDDLPCMDDDDLRRGKPTNHKVYGESLAVIAGDSLMIWAFGFALKHLLEEDIPPLLIVRALRKFADCAGPMGMCGGQVLDTDVESRLDTEEHTFKIASMKTAAMMRASVVCGAILAGASDGDIDAFDSYGEHLGMAFQIIDDVLDEVSTAEELGKTPKKDAEQDKMTFVARYGIEGARRLAEEESQSAANALANRFSDADLLVGLARDLVSRTF